MYIVRMNVGEELIWYDYRFILRIQNGHVLNKLQV